jgi:hypothetical protein
VSDLVWPDTTRHGQGSLYGTAERAGRWETHARSDEQRDLMRRLQAELEQTDLPGVKLDVLPWSKLQSGQPRPYPSCWYCGSLHPQSLYQLLTAGEATLHGADWKYGWPHKFYVDTPNPDPIPWLCSSSSGGLCVLCGGTPADPICPWCDGKGHNPHHVRAGDPLAFSRYEQLQLKFYNSHLEELEPAAFDALAAEIQKHSRIEFLRSDEGALGYRAPYRGYQA